MDISTVSLRKKSHCISSCPCCNSGHAPLFPNQHSSLSTSGNLHASPVTADPPGMKTVAYNTTNTLSYSSWSQMTARTPNGSNPGWQGCAPSRSHREYTYIFSFPAALPEFLGSGPHHWALHFDHHIRFSNSSPTPPSSKILCDTGIDDRGLSIHHLSSFTYSHQPNIHKFHRAGHE